MEIDPVRYSGRPSEKRSEQEDAIYDKLEELGIAFDRVDHTAADNMADCLLIEEALGGRICKNLFLRNRQATEFYLLMLPGDKSFKTKTLSPLLGCSRLSFGEAEHLAALLRTVPGSVSALELLFDTEGRVKLVIDRDLLREETVSGHPGFSTSTVRLKREDLLRYAEAVGHTPTVVELPREDAAAPV
ncbi:MAG: prolyl-tRNA synthetase associated domain-containing protein [Oscillospiraceae bacterium]|nr:prolyl-tRNA synthetase associated domain-containing protein [Oscillospiraceae bacterium]